MGKVEVEWNKIDFSCFIYYYTYKKGNNRFLILFLLFIGNLDTLELNYKYHVSYRTIFTRNSIEQVDVVAICRLRVKYLEKKNENVYGVRS